MLRSFCVFALLIVALQVASGCTGSTATPGDAQKIQEESKKFQMKMSEDDSVVGEPAKNANQ
jgi:outer membrane lipoprotein-sorting protein